MSTDEIEDESDGAPSGAEDDPLEDRTQPMERERPPRELDSRTAADTTTLGVPIPPPIVLDDEDATEHVESVSSAARGARVEVSRVVADASLRPILLERIEPSIGRGERLRLDASRSEVRVGRAEENDLRLYTASASRHHAVIAGDANGAWRLTPASGKSVTIDGEESAESVVLEVGMNIVLGQDHLRCVTEGLESEEMAAGTAAGGLAGTDASSLDRLRRMTDRLGPIGWTIALASLAALAWLLFAGGGG